MKKFMKGCAITALILVVLGFVLAIVGGSVGGTKAVNEVVQSVTDGKIHINLGGDGDGFGIIVNEEEWFNIGENVHFDINSNLIFDNAYEVYSGDVERYMVGTDITKLDIEVGGCEIKLDKSEDNHFYAQGSNTGKFQCYEKNGTLYVKTLGTEDDWSDLNHSCICIYVPEGYIFEKIEVELGAGQLCLGEIAATEVDAEVGAGQILIDYLQADKCKVEVGMGELIVNDMQVTKMDAEVGMGHLMFTGTLIGDVNAECAMGSLDMKLNGSEEDFNYAIESAVGNISIGGSDYSGLAQDKKIRNGADKNMTLECAMGNIQIDFKE